MCRPKNGVSQDTIYNGFIQETKNKLTKYGMAIVFRDYQVMELQKIFGKDKLQVEKVENYYRLSLIRN